MCGLKILKVDKLTLKLKLMKKKCIDKIKVVDNSYSDENYMRVSLKSKINSKFKLKLS